MTYNNKGDRTGAVKHTSRNAATKDRKNDDPEPKKGPVSAESNEKDGAKTSPASATPPASNENEGRASRVAVSWYVNDKGVIEFDRMRPKMKEALKNLITDPEVIKNLGISQQQAKDAVEVVDFITPEACGFIYDTLAKVEKWIAVKKGVSPEIAATIFSYTKDDKEKLCPLTARVLNKYATEWMRKYREEIQLAFMFLTITAVKVAMLKMTLQAQELSKTKAPAPARTNGAETPAPVAETSAAPAPDAETPKVN